MSSCKWFGWLWHLLRWIGDEGCLTDLSLKVGLMVFFSLVIRDREMVEAEGVLEYVFLGVAQPW